jgi:hypothetical protein
MGLKTAEVHKLTLTGLRERRSSSAARNRCHGVAMSSSSIGTLLRACQSSWPGDLGGRVSAGIPRRVRGRTASHAAWKRLPATSARPRSAGPSTHGVDRHLQTNKLFCVTHTQRASASSQQLLASLHAEVVMLQGQHVRVCMCDAGPATNMLQHYAMWGASTDEALRLAIAAKL